MNQTQPPRPGKRPMTPETLLDSFLEIFNREQINLVSRMMNDFLDAEEIDSEKMKILRENLAGLTPSHREIIAQKIERELVEDFSIGMEKGTEMVKILEQIYAQNHQNSESRLRVRVLDPIFKKLSLRYPTVLDGNGILKPSVILEHPILADFWRRNPFLRSLFGSPSTENPPAISTQNSDSKPKPAPESNSDRTEQPQPQTPEAVQNRDPVEKIRHFNKQGRELAKSFDAFQLAMTDPDQALGEWKYPTKIGTEDIVPPPEDIVRMVTFIAEREGIPFQDFMDFVFIESRFHENAESDSDYKGLMQIHTASVADVLGHDRAWSAEDIEKYRASKKKSAKDIKTFSEELVSSDFIYDPFFNLLLGAKYYKKCEAAAQEGLGRKPENWEIYAFYNEGSKRGKAILNHTNGDLTNLASVDEKNVSGVTNNYAVIGAIFSAFQEKRNDQGRLMANS
jgi:hypothetical protein